MSRRRFDAIRSVVLCRRYPLLHTLEVDLNGIDSAARDGRRLGTRHVVEVGWLYDERRRPINFTVVVVWFL